MQQAPVYARKLSSRRRRLQARCLLRMVPGTCSGTAIAGTGIVCAIIAHFLHGLTSIDSCAAVPRSIPGHAWIYWIGHLMTGCSK